MVVRFALNVTNGIWTSDNVTINFYPPLTLPSNYSYDVGLARVDTWNSIHNIKAVYNNNTLRYSPDTGTTWKTLVLPDGNYEIEDIDTALKNFMYDNGDFNNTNPASNKLALYSDSGAYSTTTVATTYAGAFPSTAITLILTKIGNVVTLTPLAQISDPSPSWAS